MEPTVAQSHEQDLAPPEPDPRPDDLYPDIVGIAAKGPIFAIASDLPQVARPVYHAPRYSEAGDPFDDETKLTTLIRQPLLRVERRRLPPQLHHGSSSPPKPPTLGTSHSEPLLARSAPLDKQADWWHDIPNKQVHSPTLRETASDQRLRLTEELSQDSLVQCHQYHDGSRPLSSLSNDSKTGPSGSPGEDTVLLSTDQSAILTSPSRLNQQRSFGGHPLQSIPEDEITQSSRSPSQNPLVTTNPREEISAPRSDATQTEIIPAGSPPEQVCKIHDAQIAPEDWQGPGVSDTGINSSGCSGNVADQHLDLSLPVNPNELAVS
ncbi:MAG: hypothetical protein M1817_005906 [Caeruleum heppii]|nr:MAG: hypothetical protein M1817_005906 [Caeruleum heppii]